jgi:hypothetical protein
MSKLGILDWVALILAIVGSINWGLVGVFDYDLVKAILGAWPSLVAVVYSLVGLAGLYLIVTAIKLSK